MINLLLFRVKYRLLKVTDNLAQIKLGPSCVEFSDIHLLPLSFRPLLCVATRPLLNIKVKLVRSYKRLLQTSGHGALLKALCADFQRFECSFVSIRPRDWVLS